MNRLDLRLAEYFVAVAEELHFGRAAERLHIAQPSLSQQIRRLEAQLGVTLLDRTSRKVELTAAGEAFLHEARAALAAADRAVQVARGAGAERVIVGFYGSAADGLLPDLLTAFAEAEPETYVSVRELLMGSVDEILDGRVDVAVTRLLPGQIEAEVEVLSSEPRVVALPADHRYARRPELRFADLREEEFVVNPIVQTGLAPERWLAEQKRHGLAGRVAEEAASLGEILALVAAGRGVCLVPASAARHHPRSGVVYVPVTDADPAVVSLAWRPDTLRPPAHAFILAARGVAARSG